MLHFVLQVCLDIFKKYYICGLEQSEKDLCTLVNVFVPLKALKTLCNSLSFSVVYLKLTICKIFILTYWKTALFFVIYFVELCNWIIQNVSKDVKTFFKKGICSFIQSTIYSVFHFVTNFQVKPCQRVRKEVSKGDLMYRK